MKELQASKRTPLSIFISYAHEDELLRQRLETHLSLLRREGWIADWHDRQILAGEEWAKEIDVHLEAASIILLLITPDFLASDYCYDIEMRQALERHDRDEARVIPIILRPCDWRSSPFARLQCLPHDGKAITTWQDSDEAFLAIARGLRRVIEEQGVPRHPLPDVERKNRRILIKRVRTTWIEGLLENSLHEAARLELYLQERPDALVNPWRLQVQELDRPPRLLPAGTSIVQVYDEVDGELLILGEPGAGKTTLLLELAYTLLQRAELEERERMPVVFNLSSWAEKRQALSDWLIAELETKYQIPHKIAIAWVNTDQLILLLDGLDEVASAHRTACINAITVYQQQHSLVPVVVCSRSAEYLTQTRRFVMHSAVVVQPLTLQQTEDYLVSGGEQLMGLRVAINNNPILQELATTPLLLNVLVLAFQGKPAEDILLTSSLQQVFTKYVERMLQRRRIEVHYASQQTVHYLGWLAQQLKHRSQVEFYIERMQSDWLPMSRSRWLYRVILEPLIGLSLGLIGGLVGGLVFGLNGALVNAVIFGIFFMYFIHLDNGINADLHPAETIIWLGVNFRPYFKKFLGFGSFFGLDLGIFKGLMNGLGSGLISGLIGGLVSGLIWLLVYILSDLLSHGSLDEHKFVSPNQGIRYAVYNCLLVGSICWLVFGVLSGLYVTLAIDLDFGMRFGLIFGLFFGIIFGLLEGGLECIKYIVLKARLWYSGAIPWNYPHFLNYAVERILLRKVGGGYIFIHRLLLDYFASLEKKKP